VDRLSPLNPERLGTLVAQEAQGEVDALGLTESCLVFGAGAAGQQVVLDLVEPGKHFWVYGEPASPRSATTSPVAPATPQTSESRNPRR
jgi:hypothetical protein